MAGTRTRRVHNIVLTLGAAGLAVGVLSFDPEGALAEMAGWLAIFWAALMVITGPQYVRNDLRGDLLKLDLLRSYPLRGSAVVLAEVAASTLVLTAIQLSLLLIGYLAFLGNRSMEPNLEVRSLLLLTSVIFLPAVNLLGVLIQNGAALFYPAWVRLGSGRTAGVEALGQNLLMVVAFVALLSLTLVLPVAIGGGSYLLLHSVLEGWAAVPAAILVLGTMAVEAAWAVEWLGGVFDRTDPVSAGIAL